METSGNFKQELPSVFRQVKSMNENQPDPKTESNKLNDRWKKLLSSMTILGVLSTSSSCAKESPVKNGEKGGEEASTSMFQKQNLELVRDLRLKGIKSENVLEALASTPRHIFVPESIRDMSYDDNALPIGLKQTISQPYIVAYMTEALNLKRSDKVLEVGTGSGYQACVLAKLVDHVYSIELLDSLAKRASKTLEALQVSNVTIKTGDGYKGMPEEAPFDAIIVTAAPAEVPQTLVGQLKEGGKMIVPVGIGDVQWLILIRKENGTIKKEKLIPVRFVPMVHGQSDN